MKSKFRHKIRTSKNPYPSLDSPPKLFYKRRHTYYTVFPYFFTSLPNMRDPYRPRYKRVLPPPCLSDNVKIDSCGGIMRVYPFPRINTQPYGREGYRGRM